MDYIMDKSWMSLDNRTLPQYQKGVQEFLDFAYLSTESGDKIRCPCRKCNNVLYQSRDDVEADLLENGIVKHYTKWEFHGEESDESDDDAFDFEEEENNVECDLDETERGGIGGNPADYVDMQSVLEDCYTATRTNAWGGDQSTMDENAVPQWESEKFMRLLRDVDKELYPGCKNFTKLSFVVTLMHLKIVGRWSNKSFSMLLELLKKALPSGEVLPQSYYEAKKIIRDLGLDYEKIHACVNDCVLFRKEHEKAVECPVCSASRYKFTEAGDDKSEKVRKTIPQKILRYFPLKPRLQRLFISKKTAEDMRWHKEKRLDDGMLRHPADAQEWKDFDNMHESFSQDPRNVRLGLATDGFNPFSNMSISYSTWPVILMPYNLPPWMCLKSPFFILSMLIPGPTSPGNDIDIFLQPLIDELKDLWSQGVTTYDAFTDTNFNLRAALLWTINDFPAYGIVSGWSTKGYLACPVCNENTCSLWLQNGKKLCYMNHRRFLPHDHKWRDLKAAFDGKKEKRNKPFPLTGDDVVEQLAHLSPLTFGKTQPKKRNIGGDLNWKKHSIFFTLPYWRTLKLRHNLDVMHIEKNICDNILDTLLEIDGRSKDNIKARFDLQALGIRHHLHPKLLGNSYLVPPACFTLSLAEKRKLCAFLASVKYPDAYAASLKRRVNVMGCRLAGLKTHDCHTILQKLLPVAVRGILDNNVCEALTEISSFFERLCSKALRKEELEYLEDRMALTLCKLERIFPPAFFDIMVHLPIHLPREVILGGPVQYRWMYPIERFLYILKQYVNNKAFPEGSMAEGYIAQECLTFCSMYMKDIETQFDKVERNLEKHGEMPPETLSVFAGNSRLLGKGNYAVLDEKSLRQAHAYVLKNCDEVLEYAREHKRELACNGCVNVEKVHDDSFSTCFERVICAPIVENPTVNENLLHLAYGPDKRVTRYEACIVSGLRFHTKQREVSKRTQNSGVMVKGEEASGLRDYYGVLTDIIKLDYLGNHEVVLFKCDWFEGKSIQKDKYNCVSVNLSRPWKTNEPYVLASQVQQVFYVNDNKLGKDWKVVVETQARSSWSVLENNDNECTVVHELSQQNDDLIEWQRNDIPGTSIAANLVKPAENRVDSFIVDEDDVDEEDCTMFEYEEEEDEEGEGEEEDDEGDEYEDEDGTN